MLACHLLIPAQAHHPELPSCAVRTHLRAGCDEEEQLRHRRVHPAGVPQERLGPGAQRFSPSCERRLSSAAPVQFFTNFSTDLHGSYPTLASIDGGYPQTIATGFGYNGESDLDLEYAQALVRHQNVTLYQVGDTVEGASFGDFLDALDASYCAGDDPNQDGVYPDPYGTAADGAYQGPKACGTFKAAYVISTS